MSVVERVPRLAARPVVAAAVVAGALAVLLAIGLATAWDRTWQDSLARGPTETRQLGPGDTFGQSFVPRHAGLRAVEVLVGAGEGSAPLSLTLRLRDSALPDGHDLRVATATLEPSATPGWVRFDFAPVAVQGQPLYLRVEGPADAGPLSVGLAGADAYRDGAFYIGDHPREAQLATRLHYRFGDLLIDSLAWLARAAAALGAALLLFALPGLALQAWLAPLPEEPLRVRFALASGLGLSAYPVLLVWAQLLGARPGPLAVWVPLALSAGALALRWVRGGAPRSGARARAYEAAWRLISGASPSGLLWLALAALVALTRLFVLRAVDAPMWGDSVQHAVISQRILEAGGLFDSWMPYAPYDTLTVHPGFGVDVAAYSWLTGADVPEAMLLVGQALNLLGALTLVPLAARLAPGRWSGVGVVLAVGLLSPLPAVYLNWGRYPQLGGQVLVPVAIWFLWALLEPRSRPRWGLAVCLALASSGVFLTYYRMPYYVMVFAAVLTAALVVGRARPVRDWARALLALVGAGALVAVLVGPWLLHLQGSFLATSTEASTQLGSDVQSVLAEYAAFAQLPEFVPTELAALAALGLAVAIWQRRAGALVVALWGAGVALLPATRLVHLPGGGYLQAFAVVISLYMPIGLLAGYGIDVAIAWAGGRRLAVVVALLGVGSLAAFGAWRQVGIVDQDYRMVAPADLRAMAWIREHTPPDARFLVDGFQIYSGSSVVGSDGGWWLPLLAHREATMPPQYALLAEHPIYPGYNAETVALVAQLGRVGVTSSEGIALLCSRGITHVYVGQGQGRVGYVGSEQPLLSLAALERSSAFVERYRQDRVGVYELDGAACR